MIGFDVASAEPPVRGRRSRDRWSSRRPGPRRSRSAGSRAPLSRRFRRSPSRDCPGSRPRRRRALLEAQDRSGRQCRPGAASQPSRDGPRPRRRRRRRRSALRPGRARATATAPRDRRWCSSAQGDLRAARGGGRARFGAGARGRPGGVVAPEHGREDDGEEERHGSEPTRHGREDNAGRIGTGCARSHLPPVAHGCRFLVTCLCSAGDGVWVRAGRDEGKAVRHVLRGGHRMRRALFLSITACLALLVAAGLAGSLAQSTPAASTAITPSPIYTVAAGRSGRRRLADAHGQPQGPPLLVADPDQQGERRHAQARLEGRPGLLHDEQRRVRLVRGERRGCGRHLLHPGPVRRRLRARRSDGRQALDVEAHLRRGLQPRFGLAQARRRDRRGQGVRRAGRRQSTGSISWTAPSAGSRK